MSGSTGTSAPSFGSLFGTTGSANNSTPSTGGGLFGGKPATTSGFSFGQPGGSTFGTTTDKKEGAPPAGGLFGSGNSMFGQTSSANTDNTTNTSKPSGGLFDTGTKPQPSLFGQPSSAGSGGNIFGKADTSTKPTGGLFSNIGNPAQTPGTPNQSSATKSIFGSTTPSVANSSNVFTGPSTTPAGQPPSSMFVASTGGASSQSQPQSGTQAPSPFGQAQTSASNTKPSLFSPSAGTGFFNTKSGDSNAQSGPGVSGGFKLGEKNEKPTESSTKTDAPKFSFPAPSGTPTSTSGQASTPLFSFKPSEPSSSSAPSQPSSSKPTGFSFQTTSSGSTQGQTAASKPPAFTGFGIGTTPSEKPSLFTKPTPPTTQSTEQSKPAGPLFPSLGSPQTSTTTSQPNLAAPAQSSMFPGFGATTQTSSATSTLTAPATTSSAPSQLFSLGTAPTTNTQPSTATTAAATSASSAVTTKFPLSGAISTGPGASILGASTAGPAPPTQSRLRNRTMDEILTRWASDLTRYTKEFKGYAEQIAHWDQIIVDNSAKIDKLYVKTRTCEKQTMSVEMQLSAVENQQNELEAWLSKYESDVEEMLAKDGTGQNEPGGPDQERERTYQLAERLSERLDDMSRDLQSMIEEVNAANASLGKSSKVDEPITQIVKILNAHLSQLQAIDQGTSALQAKVSAAQNAASGMNYLTGAVNGDHRGVVDDFYRSYRGRR